MKKISICVSAVLLLILSDAALAQQQNCASPSTTEAIKKFFLSKAASSVDFWLALQINTPQYRMKEVRFQFDSMRQIGKTYAGIDCQGLVKLFSPPDAPKANAVGVPIKYVVLNDGGVDIYSSSR